MDGRGSEALTIEPATVTDAAEILALQRLAFQREAQRYHEPVLPPLRQTLAELVAEFETHLIVKAIVEDSIVGSVRASAEAGACSIGRLMVHPRLQQQGIGAALMRHIEAHFPDAKQFQLSTGAQSMANIRLYERLGYTITATESVTDRVSIVIMTKMAQRPALTTEPSGSNQSHDGGAPS